MPFLNFVKRGDRLEVPSAEWHNAIAEVLNQQLAAKRGIVDKQTQAINEFKSPRKPFYVRANADIDEYSIFTIQEKDTAGSGSGSFVGTGSGTGTGSGDEASDMDFDARYPRVYSKRISTGDQVPNVFIVNSSIPLILDNDYLLNSLGDEWPAIVKIDLTDGVPLIGEEIGVKDDTYKVAKGYYGLIAVSAVDFVEDLIWVVKKGGGGTTTTSSELVELCLANDHPGRGIPFSAYLGTWSPANNRWDYGGDCEGQGAVHAIDWRCGVPHPAAGAKGLFTPRESDLYGLIYECVSLDCENCGPDCCEYGTGSSF